MAFSNFIRAWLLLVSLIPSVLVAIFNLYHLLTSRALRKALNNHVIIVLLVCGLIDELTDGVWVIHLYRTGTALSSTPAFCRISVFFGASIYISVCILMAWASIERHILIFYPNWYGTSKKRFFLHYLPLVISIAFPTVFYFIVFFIVPCTVPLNYEARSCGLYSCLIRLSWASLWDSVAHFMMPAFVTIAFSMALFVRVLYHRYHIRGRIDWRNYKKMAVQLLPVSVLYLVLQFPPLLLYAAYSAGLPRTVGSSYYGDGLFFSYWAVMFTPFATVMSLPDLKTKCRKLIFFWRRPRAVQPETLAMTRRNVGQTIVVKPKAITQPVGQTTAPAETAPAETAPAETAPAETAPAETAPEETVPDRMATTGTTLMQKPAIEMTPIDI